MISSTDLRPGITFKINDDIFVCLEAQHNKTARAAANIKVKMKNLRSGAIVSHTFNSGEKLAKAKINKVDMQYLYEQNQNIVFMNLETYDQLEIKKTTIEWEINFLQEEDITKIRLYHNEVLGIELPPKMNLTIIEAEPAVKGDSATNVQIKVKTSTGLELHTPDFIKSGDVIEVNTNDGSYSGRVTK